MATCFPYRMKPDLGNLTEEGVQRLKKKQLQDLLTRSGLPKSGNVRDLQDRVLRLKKKSDKADVPKEGEEEIPGVDPKKEPDAEKEHGSVSSLRSHLTSASASIKRKKWRVTDLAKIAPNFFHKDLFAANFPLVEIVDVPVGCHFPVQDKFEGNVLDEKETAQARWRWFNKFLEAEHAYCKAETERQAFPVHFAFLDGVWKFTKPSRKDVEIHNQRCVGLKRK
ncbi:hypothetical protein GOP47_0006621 [Adiantum capillus-veneris]|uniref:SAP domain-containing protein n=1 Tax=Adiantum capillus-veneris TaxID=13818 RepID=A0A9D4V3S7_ADICA|nr:hypothetical protein GOP47_0006621 [Adiantum capillus-veneris]